VARFHNKLTDIYTTIKEFDPKMIKFTIYGEYFGGNWPANHPNSVKGGPKAVQKGIYYTPEHEFMAFDIFIVTVETAYWADVFDIPKLLKDNIKSVPVHTKGTFDEVFNINTVIDSTIPELLGLPKLEKNIIEGMVIRPNKNVKNENNDRVIIKKKNQEFLEKVAEPKEGKKKEKKEQQVDPEIAPFLEELLKYLNVNRIESVVSKFPELKDRNKLKELVLKDILTDAEKDEVKLPEAVDEKHKKLIKELTNHVMKEVNSYFIKH
jgi:Rnl2 family RNA ligase